MVAGDGNPRKDRKASKNDKKTDSSLKAAAKTERLWEGAREMARTIREGEGPLRLVGHYDGDGLTGAAILTLGLRRAGIPVQLSIFPGLDQAAVEGLVTEQNPRILFNDLGSGQRRLLDRLSPTQVMIVDHHLQQGERPSHVVEMNAHELGSNGTYGACGASMALTVAVSLDPANWDLVQPALAGIIADRQHLPRLSDINLELLEEGIRRGYILRGEGLALPSEKTLARALADSLDPYFVGLAGRESAARKWLKRRGFDPEAVPGQLEERKLRHLANELLLALLAQGATHEAGERLFFPDYTLKDYPVEASILAKAINAAGREGERDLGVAAAMGDGAALEQVTNIRAMYDEKVRDGLLGLEELGPTTSPAGHFHYFESREPKVKGAVAGLAAAYWLCRKRPLLALSVRDERLDISSRASQHLVARGIDLARAMAQAARACDGQGGGHPIAAGASVPLDRKAEFLDAVDSSLGEDVG